MIHRCKLRRTTSSGPSPTRRAGLAALDRLPDESLAQVAAAVESVKTGRPPGKKKKKRKTKKRKKKKTNRRKGKKR
jgi:hypothetical protein